jgi:predicted amidohydrolase YtcJ
VGPWHDARAVRTLYRAERVHTLSHPPVGSWVLVDDRHVQRVGTGEPPGSDRLVELPGATIVPGFIDSHFHMTSTGWSIRDREVSRADSRERILELAGERAGEGEGLVWLQGFDETTWDDPGLPEIASLDAVTARPLVIGRVDGHVALANNAAIEASGIVDEPGVERGADGRPTGRVSLGAMAMLSSWAMSTLTDREIQELQLDAAALAASTGITTVHEMSMPSGSGWRDLEVLMEHKQRLPVDCFPIVATMDIPQVIDLGLTTIGGDLPVDGSVGARTAALESPYADIEGSGNAYYQDDDLAAFFHGGHVAGLQVGVHAIGDRAIEQVLSAWERVYQVLDSRERRHFRARRHRIEHFEMPSAGQIERGAMLGLAVSVQPAFDKTWGSPGGLYEIGLGSERAARMNPFRAMLERGIELGAGSDSPITPADPMLMIESLEQHHDPTQRLSRSEAIRLLTTGSARLSHQEEKKGALAPGMHADLAAFDEDPFESPSVGGLRPVLTVSLGREVFAR